METNRLKPCPFCGILDIEPDPGARGFIFFCVNCGAKGPDLDNTNLEEAAGIWNTRDGAAPPWDNEEFRAKFQERLEKSLKEEASKLPNGGIMAFKPKEDDE